MENFELKYKSALGSATTMYACAQESNDKEMIQSLELIFPELKKSEDERIREEILNCFVEMKKQGCFPSKHEEQYDSWISWLKKQDEQKSTNKEPKFKVGDWVVSDCNNVAYVEFINGTKYVLCKDGYHEKMSIEYVDKCWHIWTIRDAKGGDVLVDKSNGTIGIFQSIGHHLDGGSYNDSSYCFLHCRYSDGYFYADFENGNTMDSDNAIPATEEQRAILFSKMEKEGYEWDSNKKELIKQ